MALGDSLSEGVGDRPWPDGSLRGWTDRLAGLLASHHGGAEYANLSVRGQTSDQVLTGQVAAGLALAPDLVTFTAGMNDLLRPSLDVEELRGTLVGIVAPFTAAGARVMVVPIPDVRAVSPIGHLLSGRRQQLNELYRYLAREHGMEPVVDTSATVFEDPRAWAEDRLHLSPLGHERLALGAAAAFGVPVAPGWARPPDGPPPRRRAREEAAWARDFVVPWVGRRLRGESSGDGRSAKRPDLQPVDF